MELTSELIGRVCNDIQNYYCASSNKASLKKPFTLMTVMILPGVSLGNEWPEGHNWYPVPQDMS